MCKNTCQLFKEELSLPEVVIFKAGWLVHGQQLDPSNLLKVGTLYKMLLVVNTPQLKF